MGPSLVQRPARWIASSTRCLTPVSRTSAPRAASLPVHASESRATSARTSAALRWPVSSAADHRAANRDTSGADETSRAPKDRSEEHTSELQSLAYLVCRLL